MGRQVPVTRAQVKAAQTQVAWMRGAGQEPPANLVKIADAPNRPLADRPPTSSLPDIEPDMQQAVLEAIQAARSPSIETIRNARHTQRGRQAIVTFIYNVIYDSIRVTHPLLSVSGTEQIVESMARSLAPEMITLLIEDPDEFNARIMAQVQVTVDALELAERAAGFRRLPAERRRT